MARAATKDELETKAAATGDDSITEKIHPSAQETEADGAPEAGLKELTGKGTLVEVRGEQFEISGWEIDDVLEVSQDLANFGIQFAGVSRDDIPVIMAIMISNLPVVKKVVGITLKKPMDWIGKIKLNDFIPVVLAIKAENEPFFRQISDLLGETRTDQQGTEETPTKSETESPQTNEAELIGSD